MSGIVIFPAISQLNLKASDVPYNPKKPYPKPCFLDERVLTMLQPRKRGEKSKSARRKTHRLATLSQDDPPKGSQTARPPPASTKPQKPRKPQKTRNSPKPPNPPTAARPSLATNELRIKKLKLIARESSHEARSVDLRGYDKLQSARQLTTQKSPDARLHDLRKYTDNPQSAFLVTPEKFPPPKETAAAAAHTEAILQPITLLQRPAVTQATLAVPDPKAGFGGVMTSAVLLSKPPSSKLFVMLSLMLDGSDGLDNMETTFQGEILKKETSKNKIKGETSESSWLSVCQTEVCLRPHFAPLAIRLQKLVSGKWTCPLKLSIHEHSSNSRKLESSCTFNLADVITNNKRAQLSMQRHAPLIPSSERPSTLRLKVKLFEDISRTLMQDNEKEVPKNTILRVTLSLVSAGMGTDCYLHCLQPIVSLPASTNKSSCNFEWASVYKSESCYGPKRMKIFRTFCVPVTLLGGGSNDIDFPMQVRCMESKTNVCLGTLVTSTRRLLLLSSGVKRDGEQTSSKDFDGLLSKEDQERHANDTSTSATFASPDGKAGSRQLQVSAAALGAYDVDTPSPSTPSPAPATPLLDVAGLISPRRPTLWKTPQNSFQFTQAVPTHIAVTAKASGLEKLSLFSSPNCRLEVSVGLRKRDRRNSIQKRRKSIQGPQKSQKKSHKKSDKREEKSSKFNVIGRSEIINGSTHPQWSSFSINMNDLNLGMESILEFRVVHCPKGMDSAGGSKKKTTLSLGKVTLSLERLRKADGVSLVLNKNYKPKGMLTIIKTELLQEDEKPR